MARKTEEGGPQDRGAQGRNRLVYCLVLLAILVPRLVPIAVPPKTMDYTRDAYRTIEGLPAGSLVLVDIGCDETPWASVGGGMIAIMTDIMSQDVKFIVVSGGSKSGPTITQLLFDGIPKDVLARKKYGVDYIRLGWVPGEEAAVASFAANLKGVYSVDIYGAPLSQMPLWQAINGARDFSLVFNAAGLVGYQGYIRHWNGPFKTPLVFAVSTKESPALLPFYASGQVAGFVAGMRGSAEYQALSHRIGSALQEATGLTFAVLVITGFVVVSNVRFIRDRAKQKVGGEA